MNNNLYLCAEFKNVFEMSALTGTLLIFLGGIFISLLTGAWKNGSPQSDRLDFS